MRPPGDTGFLAPEACTIERQVFHDASLQAEFEQRGYVVLPFLTPAEVDALAGGYDQLALELDGSSKPEDFDDTYAEFSVIHSRPEFRRRAYELICSVLAPVADRYLVDHRPLIANFVNKLPGTGVVPTHQNFSVVDEAEFRSVSVWVALVDCTLDNGAMSMLDRSHQTLRGRRGMWAYQAFGQIAQADLDPLLTRVDVPAGHAVILDDALVHYSPPNQTDERRLAIQFVMVPSEAPALWFQQVGTNDDGLDVTVWEVDERYFFEFWHGDGDSRFATRGGQITLPQTALDLAALHELLGAPDESRSEGADAPAPPSEPEPEPEPAPRPAAAPQRGLRALISRLSR